MAEPIRDRVLAHVARHFKDHGTGVRAGQVAKRLRVSPQSVTLALGQLLEDGLISRVGERGPVFPAGAAPKAKRKPTARPGPEPKTAPGQPRRARQAGGDGVPKWAAEMPNWAGQAVVVAIGIGLVALLKWKPQWAARASVALGVVIDTESRLRGGRDALLREVQLTLHVAQTMEQTEQVKADLEVLANASREIPRLGLTELEAASVQLRPVLNREPYPALREDAVRKARARERRVQLEQRVPYFGPDILREPVGPWHWPGSLGCGPPAHVQGQQPNAVIPCAICGARWRLGWDGIWVPAGGPAPALKALGRAGTAAPYTPEQVAIANRRRAKTETARLKREAPVKQAAAAGGSVSWS